MSEIEKLYKTAGYANTWVQRYDDGYYEREHYYNSYKVMIKSMMEKNGWTLTEAQEVAKKECKKEHPPFTAKKQIELIKWLVKNQDIFKITYHREFLWCSSIEWVESDCYEEFEESLADLINTIWQDLTPEEKQQVKGILE